METLNTPNEIALWTSAACAFATTRTYPATNEAAQFADSMVLELRKRLPTNAISAVPEMGKQALLVALIDAKAAGKRVCVHFGNGDKSEGILTKSGDMWVLDGHEYFGTGDGYGPEERAVSVEILPIVEQPTPESLNEQLRLAAELSQRVCATMASGYAVSGRVEWHGGYDDLPALIDGGYWCGALYRIPNHRVVRVEILDA